MRTRNGSVSSVLSDKETRSSPEFDEKLLTVVHQRRLLLAAEHLQQWARRSRARVYGDVVAGAVAATRIEVLSYKVTMHPGRFKELRYSLRPSHRNKRRYKREVDGENGMG